jgi:hypothetical protein
MADYSIDETLRRTLALERMKYLSDALYDAKCAGDLGLMHAIARERQELKELYFKVVK